ncbi:ATP-dependent DNA ligase [Arthrobacter pascens]|uniref:ATP-dependent DNA ligase n=1 Tax=Arthrobacter pascens TaxID=1677 RepID=UPI0027950161|nr:ATP-dependent DNA ligase [Arthrobacter pascens]MDQ0679100.1 ATP-dependent DNA ligase [Arthrobacter pascens]
MDGLPKGLWPPLSLALARAVDQIPAAGALPGGCLYEPKWDGFRLAVFVGKGEVSLWSRQGKNLSRYFPDLVAAAVEQIPPGFVVDGEAVIWSKDRLDFEALQQRMTTSKAKLTALSRDWPAAFAAFDLLASAGHDTRGVPLVGRRELLEALAEGWRTPLSLSPATMDRDLAMTWFDEMPAAGIEGLVIKGAVQTYEGGQRQWLKVKHRDVLDVVCGAVIGSRSQPTVIIAGLPVGGKLRIVGRSSVLSAKVGRELARYLMPPAGAHPWPEEISQGMLDRFSKEKGPVALTLVQPMVVEVSADVAWSGNAFRNSLRYIRARPELEPHKVELPPNLAKSA